MSVEMQAMLQQMQQIQAMAKGQNSNPPEASAPAARQEFSQMLQQAIEGVNQQQVQAADLQQAFELGDQKVDLVEVMVSMQQARISFQALTEVRNKMLSAYQEVMSMPV